MIWWQWALIAFSGAVAGSFALVVATRDRREPWWRGRSHCPHCRAELGPLELVPLLSFFILRGRCAHCHLVISWRHPLSEVAGAAIFVAVAAGAGWSVVFLWQLPLLLFFLILGISDSVSQRMPLAGLAAAVVCGWLAGVGSRGWDPLVLLSGTIFGGFFLILWLLSRGRWVGSGDIGLGAAIGLWLGWPLVAVAFWVTYVTGAVVAIALLVARRARRDTRIPFAPLLIFGAVIAFVWGPYMVNLYVR